MFVFPSLTDTFGVVQLAALACGTPVAAFPVTGPLDVIADHPVGALDKDLRAACLRALTVLRGADRVFCEDTRVTGKLLARYGISTFLGAYHDHNAEQMRPTVLTALRRGERVALVSDAGTPQGDDYLFRVDNPLVVPVDRKVRIITTATDVIHAWMVPAFGVKQDAIPGYTNHSWFQAVKPGVFKGQCAELCGRNHANMLARVIAVPV